MESQPEPKWHQKVTIHISDPKNRGFDTNKIIFGFLYVDPLNPNLRLHINDIYSVIPKNLDSRRISVFVDFFLPCR